MGGIISQEAIKQFQALMDQVDETLQRTFQNVHQGYMVETFARFPKAREWNVVKAHKMLMDCLDWRVQNEIDYILADDYGGQMEQFKRLSTSSESVRHNGLKKHVIRSSDEGDISPAILDRVTSLVLQLLAHFTVSSCRSHSRSFAHSSGPNFT